MAMPSCATTPSIGRESGGKRKAWACGARAPSKDGPSSTPAIISPMTCGWRSQRRTIHPHSRQAARITNICRKKIMDGKNGVGGEKWVYLRKEVRRGRGGAGSYPDFPDLTPLSDVPRALVRSAV